MGNHRHNLWLWHGVVQSVNPYPDTIAHQIFKANDIASADIVFLVFTGRIDDEPLNKFMEHTEKNGRLHCIIDSRDLARLFVSYKQF
jgi:hypothetical protein